MSTTREEIRGWLKHGVEKRASHVVVLCDTWDWSDFPVLVFPGEDPREEIAKRRKKYGDMYKVMECYDLGIDLEAQLAEHRAQHWTPHRAEGVTNNETVGNHNA